MADAGFRLTVEGEKEFKAALAAIDAQIKTNKAELKLLTEQYALSDDSMDGLVEKQKKLGEAYEAQAEKVRLLEDQYRQSADTYGENDAAVLKLKDSLIAAQTALASVSNEQEKNQRAMDAAWESMERQRAGLEEYQENTRRLEEYLSELGAGIEETDRQLAGLADQYDSLGGSSKELREKQKNLKEQNELLSDRMNKQQRVIETLNRELKNAEDLYGKNSDEVEDYRKQIDKATDELADMKVQMDKNNDAMKEAADDGGGALYEALEKVLDVTGIEIPESIQGMIKGFDNTALAVGGIVGALVGVAGKAAEIFKETTEWADELTRKSQVMGIDTGTYQALEYAASNLGIEMDAIDDALNEISLKATEAMSAVEDYYTETERLKQEAAQKKQELLDDYLANQPKFEAGKTLAELEEEIAEHERQYAESLKKIEKEYSDSMEELLKNTDEAIEVFDSLGISIDDGTGKIRPIIDIFYDIVDALNETDQPAERLGKAVDLLGEEARQLNPLFDAGADVLHKYMQEASDLGIILDNETVASLDEAERKANAFGLTLEAVKRNFVPDFIQGLKDIKNVVTTFELPFKNIGELITGAWDDLNVLLGGGYTDSITKHYASKGYATGTYNHPGRYAVVGERGPEIVDLPRGSKVYPNGEIPDGMGGGTNVWNISINASSVREFNDIVKLAQSARQSMRMG